MDREDAAADGEHIRVLAIVSFTSRGRSLGEKIADSLKEPVGKLRWRAETAHKPHPLGDWCGKWFYEADALLFIGALGIAVRTIAPFLQDKTKDPAVLAADEKGMHLISVLSGHLGGANELALGLAGRLGAEPVITTASDVNGKIAVDVFARDNNLHIWSLQSAKEAAAAIVAGENVRLNCEGRIKGESPPELRTGHEDARYEIRISPYENGNQSESLWLIPKAFVLGIGCKKGKSLEEIEARVLEELEHRGISIHSIKAGATIDIKKEESGLRGFFEKYKIPLTCYSSRQLMEAPGTYQPSEFVKTITGTDNVCERAAVLRALEEAETREPALEIKKSGKAGVTIALARLDWSVEFE